MAAQDQNLYINLQALLFYYQTSKVTYKQYLDEGYFNYIPLQRYQDLMIDIAKDTDKVELERMVLRSGSFNKDNFDKTVQGFLGSRNRYYDLLSQAIRTGNYSILKNSGFDPDDPEVVKKNVEIINQAEKAKKQTVAPQPVEQPTPDKQPRTEAKEEQKPVIPKKIKAAEEAEVTEELPKEEATEKRVVKPSPRPPATVEPKISPRTRIVKATTPRFGRREFFRRISGGGRAVGQAASSSIAKDAGSFLARGTKYTTTRTVSGLGGFIGNTFKGLGGSFGLSMGGGGGSTTGAGVVAPRRIAGGSGGGRFGNFGRGIGGVARIAKGVPWWIWLLLLLLIFFIFFLWIPSVQECGKGGEVELQKSGPAEVANGKQIDYQILVSFKGSCVADVTVTDQIPANTKFVKADSSYKILGGFDTMNVGSEGKLTGNQVVWELKGMTTGQTATLTLSVEPTAEDVWVVNQASYNTRFQGGSTGTFYGEVSGLLPTPLPAPAANWGNIKDQIIAAFNKHPELIEVYKQASSVTGVPWQLLAGLHFVETGSGPGPDSSLVSGRKIGQVEPDIAAFKCASGVPEPGRPVPIGRGCGFSTQLDSAIYAAKHLAEKIGKIPTTFQEAVTAMSRYNGGGNANCGEGLDYGPCPPQFPGEDDPYAMSDFDESHSQSKMYIIFCADLTRCNPPRTFRRPGAMGVVRALSEQTIP